MSRRDCVNAPRSLRIANCIAAGSAFISMIACGGADGAASPTAPSTLTPTQVTVTGPSMLMAIGERAQFVATVRFSDGSTQDRTNAAQWTSSDTSVASVSAGGLATAAGGGRADLRATFQSVIGVKQVEVTLSPPPANSNVTGRIENLETVTDLITYHQNAVGGSVFRKAGIIARWELPIPVFVDSSASARNVEQALAYWQSVTGLPYVVLGSNMEPRILSRAGMDGLDTAGGRGLIDGTYSNGRARSGLVVIRTDLAACDFAQTSCAVLYEHELGHAIGLLDHVAGGGIMSGGSRASLREINMLVELYRLPHGTHIEPDGTWSVMQ